MNTFSNQELTECPPSSGVGFNSEVKEPKQDSFFHGCSYYVHIVTTLILQTVHYVSLTHTHTELRNSQLVNTTKQLDLRENTTGDETKANVTTPKNHAKYCLFLKKNTPVFPEHKSKSQNTSAGD